VVGGTQLLPGVSAAAPKYLGKLAAADVFTFDSAFAVLESLQSRVRRSHGRRA
jgi:hypothetical protein